MKVGNLVRAGDSVGVILNIEYVKAGQWWVTCVWDDGIIEGIADGDIEVINEQLETMVRRTG